MTDQSYSEFHIARPLQARVRRHAFKRGFDILVTLPLVIILAPAILAIWAMIRLRVESGGSAFYGHERVGRDGETFYCLKFKTMRDDGAEILAAHLQADPAANAEWERTHKLKDDPRVIPGLGRFLRCSSLDELPQLFNVLRGDMSLVGPRPVTEEELEQYGASRRHYLSVRPGVTGPWQVGERSACSFQERVSQDRHYVLTSGFGTDIIILLRTLGVPFRSDNAY